MQLRVGLTQIGQKRLRGFLRKLRDGHGPVKFQAADFFQCLSNLEGSAPC